MVEALIAAGIPAVFDLFKSGISALSRKWIGLSVDDEIKLMGAEMDKLKALAELDNPHGTPSQWVVDLRGSFRYIGALLVIAVGVMLLFMEEVETGAELVALPFGFIFGERMTLSLKGGKR